MKCIEIMINGEKVCIAGTSNINQLQALITQGIESITPSIVANGSRQVDTNKFEHIEWLNRPLSESDIITIRFVDCDQATQPVSIENIDTSDSYDEYEQKVAQEIAKLRMSKKDSDLN